MALAFNINHCTQLELFFSRIILKKYSFCNKFYILLKKLNRQKGTIKSIATLADKFEAFMHYSIVGPCETLLK